MPPPLWHTEIVSTEDELTLPWVIWKASGRRGCLSWDWVDSEAEKREKLPGRKRGTPAGEKNQMRRRTLSTLLLASFQSTGCQSLGGQWFIPPTCPCPWEQKTLSAPTCASIVGHQSLWAKNLPYLSAQTIPQVRTLVCPLPGLHSTQAREAPGMPSGSCSASVWTAFYGPFVIPQHLSSGGPSNAVQGPVHCRVQQWLLGWVTPGVLREEALPQSPSKIIWILSSIWGLSVEGSLEHISSLNIQTVSAQSVFSVFHLMVKHVEMRG